MGPGGAGLTDAVAAFRADGYAHLPGLLDPTQVDALRDALTEADHAPGPYGILANDLYHSVPAFRDLIDAGALAAAVRPFLGGAGVVLFSDNLVVKTPGAPPLQWHQDFGYQPLSAPDGVTLWLALDDATEGCLHYLPGSHLRGERAPADFFPDASAPPSDLPPLTLGPNDRGVPVPCRPGDALVHHPLTWHMSPATPTVRRAWSLNWVTPQVRWDPGHAPHPLNFRLGAQPGDPLDPAFFPTFDPL